VYRVENDIGYLLLEQGQLDSAEKHLRAALKGSEELGMDRRGRGFILNNLGDVSLRRGRPEEATEYVMQALEAGEALGEGIVIAEANLLLGQIDEHSGNPRTADQRFEAAIGVLEKLGMPYRLRDCHMMYAELLEARQDIVGAAQHWRRAAEIGKLSAAGIKPSAATTVQDRSISSAG
jgi:tetratricopeptide (TPR) repeat protein